MSSISVRFNSFSFSYSIFNEHKSLFIGCRFLRLVGLDGLEPSTSRLSGVRSNHLSYKPILSLNWYWFFHRSFVHFPFSLSEEWKVNSEEVIFPLERLVEMMGIEPMTPCLQGRCSPSWATPPYLRVCSFSMIINESLRFWSLKIEQQKFHTSLA